MPPTSAWCAREHGEADRRARDERDVGEVRAAGERVVDDEDLAGLRVACRCTAATASGIAPRWTGMCSAWAIIRPRSSNSAVEQSRRSLMFAEKAERTSTAPISSATARSALPMNLELNIHVLVERSSVLFPSLSPTHPGGIQQVAPSSSTTLGPVDPERLAGRQLERRARPRPRPFAPPRARSRGRGRA